MSSSVTMAADSTQMDAKNTSTGKKKRKKPTSKKTSKKNSSKKTKVPRKTTDSASDLESDLDLKKELKPIGGYVRDREEMIGQMFHSISASKLRGMLPDILKPYSVDELKSLCLEQVEVMSKKRILRILDGADPETISSSGTDEDSLPEEEGELVDLEPGVQGTEDGVTQNYEVNSTSPTDDSWQSDLSDNELSHQCEPWNEQQEMDGESQAMDSYMAATHATGTEEEEEGELQSLETHGEAPLETDDMVHSPTLSLQPDQADVESVCGSYNSEEEEGEVLPEQNEGDIPPEQNEGDVLPEQNEGDVLPEQNEGDMPSEWNEGQVLPEDEEEEPGEILSPECEDEDQEEAVEMQTTGCDDDTEVPQTESELEAQALDMAGGGSDTTQQQDAHALSLTQMEILELEMRARAIKSMLKVADHLKH